MKIAIKFFYLIGFFISFVSMLNFILTLAVAQPEEALEA